MKQNQITQDALSQFISGLPKHFDQQIFDEVEDILFANDTREELLDAGLEETKCQRELTIRELEKLEDYYSEWWC